MGRLFSESSVNTESSRTFSTTTEPVSAADGQQALTVTTSKKTEVRGSMIIHHDTDEETDHAEVTSVGDSIDISEDDHQAQQPIAVVARPLNEIEELEEEDDEVVTVLKTPRPLHAKANFPKQDELLESPLAAKRIPREEMDLDGSDKENVPTLFKAATPRPSDRSDSYVTAVSSFPPKNYNFEVKPLPQLMALLRILLMRKRNRLLRHRFLLRRLRQNIKCNYLVCLLEPH